MRKEDGSKLMSPNCQVHLLDPDSQSTEIFMQTNSNLYDEFRCSFTLGSGYVLLGCVEVAMSVVTESLRPAGK